MRLSILSWNGDTRINDTTNFVSLIMPGSLINLTSQAVYVDRPEQFPYLSGIVLPAHSFTWRINLPGGVASISTQRELLKQIFPITDFTPHALIAIDQDNSNKQWQLIGFPVRITVEPSTTTDTAFLITLAIAEPVWSSVTLNTDTWTVASGGPGNQRTITPGGNIFARPKFAITPTAARTGQFQYSRFCSVYNQKRAYLSNYPIDITNGGINTSTLINDTTVSNQINQVGGIGAGDTTIPINTPVGGGLQAVGMGYIGTEQISWTSNGGGTSLTGVTRGIGGTTAATHANGSVIARSKMLANGADISVQVDGQTIPSWVSGINTASTKIWSSLNYQPAIWMWRGTADPTPKLATALPNNATPVTVQFSLDIYSYTFLTNLKGQRNIFFLIDNEIFTATAANISTTILNNGVVTVAQIANCNRAQKGSATAAHSVGASIFFVEHDIWLNYGNQNAIAPSYDLNTQPLIDLTNSTNTSWVQSTFYDSTATLRPGVWAGAVLTTTGKQSFVYGGNQEAVANPYTELGMSLQDFQVSNVWKSESAQIQWSFSHPIGFTTVSMAGKKFLLAGTSWPTAALQVFNTNNAWQNVWTEAIPALNTWTAWTHNGVALGATYNVLRLALVGTIAAVANNKADLQGDTVTLALDSTFTPVVSLGAEVNNQYYLSLKLTNTTTGDFFTLAYAMLINRTLTVDCAAKTVTYDDGTNAVGAITPSTVRNDWLTLLPSANVLQADDSGMTALTIVTNWNDRTL